MASVQNAGGIALEGVGAALRSRRSRILEQWGREMPEAGELLQEEIRFVLAQLTADETPQAEARPAEPPPAFQGRPETRIRDLLRGYAALRRAIFEQVSLELNRDLRGDETVALNGRLDELSGQRLWATAERQLADMRAMSDAQSKYTSFLSHDLRGGLNGIILMLEVMRRELEGRPEFAESLADLSMMRKNVADIVAVMERHSLAERLRRGRTQVMRRPVDIRMVISGAVDNCSRKTKGAQPEVITDAPEGAVIQSDPELISLVVQNLVENALQHGRGPVRISAHQEEGTWVISVSDQGPGMPQEMLDQFLDPVRRVEIKERGLGLIICQHAARLLGGRVEGESAPGRGMTVKLLLPG